jgi:hypothetical protein
VHFKNGTESDCFYCHTTAVEDIERKAPTKIPSEALPPHNCKIAYNQNCSIQNVIWKSPLMHKILTVKHCASIISIKTEIHQTLKLYYMGDVRSRKGNNMDT